MWNKETFGWLDFKLDEATSRINNEDLIPTNDEGSMNEWKSVERRQAVEEFWSNLSLKENLLRQKSHQNWLREGYKNTKYFHAIIKERRRRNLIILIANNEGSQIKDVEGIRGEILRVFKSRFMDPLKDKTLFDGLVVNKVTLEDNDYLASAFTQEEIRMAVWEASREKSLRLDRFNLRFRQ